MGAEGQKPGTSPLVFLSLCMSLLAVALSAIALLVANDQMRLDRRTRASAEIRTVQWDWEGKIGRVEKALERARGLLTKGGDKSHESAEEQVRSVRGELEAWVKAAEPRFQDLIAEMSKQADEARAALRDRSEQAGEKLNALGQSLRAFREKVGLKKGETPAEEKPKGSSK
jgi:hypothetical protein